MKLVFCSVISLLFYFFASAQSETNNLITYDTTINVVNASNNGQGTGGAHWLIRVTRPANYFTANSPDTASRPLIMTMPGAGEVQTGAASDTNFLTAYGPHFWQKNGWNMAIQLGNGTHYPLYITVVQPGANTRPWYTLGLVRSIKAIFHPKVIHVGGLSQGSYEWGCLIGYSNNTTGDHEAMSDIKSWVDLEGVGPETFQNSGTPTDEAMPASFATWATTYGGTLFGLEGTQDTRNIWQLTQAMNTAKANTGYFCYEDDGNPPGSHCCWNDFYNPSLTDWRVNPIASNPYLVASTSPATTGGNYFYNPTTGTNIFQWMLRQGDTTLIGAGAPIVNAGSNQNIQLPTNSATLSGTVNAGTGHSILSQAWSKLSGPAGGTITSTTSLTTTITSLVAGVYVYQLTATNEIGTQGFGTVNITVLAEISPTVSSGVDQNITLPTTTTTLVGSATGNAGATVTSTLWSFLSGPSTPIIVSPSNLTTTVNSLSSSGTYSFKLLATDNNNNSNSDTVNVTVASGTAPTVSISPNTISLLLPTNFTSLNGTVTPNGGATITSILWTQTSGPNTGTFSSTTTAVTNISNLISGTYVFKLTGKDNNNNSTSANVNVSVSSFTKIPKTIVGEGEYQVVYLDSTRHLYAAGQNYATLGVNQAGTLGLPIAVSVIPSNLKYSNAFGGLHGWGAIDTAGNMHTAGDNSQGALGVGNTTASFVDNKILVDSAGNPFFPILSATAFFAGNNGMGWYAIKGDSTLWVWGFAAYGMRGNGTNNASDTNCFRPVQIVIPGGRKVIQIVAGQEAIALCSDGTVWTWGGGANGGGPGASQNLGYAISGNSWLSPVQLTGLSSIVQISMGVGFHYALASNGNLFGWGYYGSHMGNPGPAGGDPISTPTLLTNTMGGLSKPIRLIVCNSSSTHVILTDSTVWGWGDNAQGCVGNGVELNMANTVPPYNWDFLPGDLLQTLPIQIIPSRHDFVAIFGSCVFTYYTYAETLDGQLYSWGRNKAGVIGNGVIGATSDIVAIYPNSWDVPLASPVNPFSIINPITSTSPYCPLNPTTTPCNEYAIPAPKTIIVNPGSTQTLTLPNNSTLLSGSATGGTIGTYVWKVLSGPNTPYLYNINSGSNLQLSNMVQGTYTLQLQAIDNQGNIGNGSVIVIINGLLNVPHLRLRKKYILKP